ncbi:MAG: GNAT family N-acetyltransferase [Lachnospiraceae bacterium]|nr:GNAT family N-acetyltransferase [Lachnospiraceae bacterium]
MKVPAFLNSNPLLYAGLIQLYRRGTVRVLEESPDGVFIQDTHGISYMLAAADGDLAASWLTKHADEALDLIMVIGEDAAARAQEILAFPSRMNVFQAVYASDTPPDFAQQLRIIPAAEKNTGFIRAHYSNLDEEELQQVIEHRQLYLGVQADGACVGFVGQHMEGSIGLLEVLPEYRRKGYGAELECFMIREMLRQGLIPYGQFKTDNHASRALQETLGLNIIDHVITWLFRE